MKYTEKILKSSLDAFSRSLNAVKGGAKFAVAIASGDIASTSDMAARLDSCHDCPHYTVKVAPGAIAESAWCGEPFQETQHTCGCLLGGKTMVASESCPSGRWGPVVCVTVEGK